jgi:hypothetical protein
MKQTLLEMTQSILSNMSSDEVDSISDTSESQQVANTIRETYFNLLSRLNLPEHDQLFQLNGSVDTTLPVLMSLPNQVNRVDWIKYYDSNPAHGTSLQSDQFGSYSHDLNLDLQNNAGGWVTSSSTYANIALGTQTFTVSSGLNIHTGDTAYATAVISPGNFMNGLVTSYSGTTLVINMTSIQGGGSYSNWTLSQSSMQRVGPGYLNVPVIPLEEFLEQTNQLDPTEINVRSMVLQITNLGDGSPSSYTFLFRRDMQPQHCCVLTNYYVIFDGYDYTQDSTLQSAKTMCHGWILPSFSMDDNFIPQLDDKQFQLLYNEAKSLCFYEYKQQPHAKAEKEINRQISALQKYKSDASIPTDFDQFPDYGRRNSRGWGRSWR